MASGWWVNGIEAVAVGSVEQERRWLVWLRVGSRVEAVLVSGGRAGEQSRSGGGGLVVVDRRKKFTQPIKYSDASCLLYKDNIDDKYMFMFMALSENEKKVLIEKVRAAQGQSEE
ncbi:hypothetical protein ACFE04_015936 [Oxalis oulophora]